MGANYKTNLERMKELVEILIKADIAYYRDECPIMSDREYDRLYDELASLEHDTKLILSGSPTQKVSGEIMEGLTEVIHSKPMLSADKTKSINDLVNFAAGKDVILSWKLDGLTLVLRYENGKMIQAITRGREGLVGEDVTHTVKQFLNVPLSVPIYESFEVRGEGVISWKNFNEINSSLTEPYSHPRGLASGSTRKLDANEAKKRKLEFFAFELISNEIKHLDKEEQLIFLASKGFDVVPYKRIYGPASFDMIQSEVKTFKPEKYSYPVDGLIMEYADLAYGKSLGATGHHENRLIALKWQDELYETKFLGVELATTRTGMVSITALLEPVTIEGTVVTRAYLHNVDIFNSFKLGIGDTVKVYKANMIIPQIAENATMSNTYKLPMICPCCGEPLNMKASSGGTMFLFCENQHCTARLVQKFAHFCEKTRMNIEGLSEITLEKFIGHGWIHHFGDLYDLEKHKDEIINTDGFGEKSYIRLHNAIEKSRKCTLDKFIAALGIPMVIKAVNAACKCMNGSDLGAIGTIDHRAVAEYKSSNSPDEYHIVVYDCTSGSILASVYDKSTEVLESYVAHSSARDGAAIMMAMLPSLLTDDEFKENFDTYYDQFLSGFSDITLTTNSMAYMCDNAYRRIKDDGCSAHLPVEIDKSGNIMRVAKSHIDSGSFTPTNVIAGEFTIFATTGPAIIKKASTFVEHSDFVGKYKLHERTLSPTEELLVPKLPEWYIIPHEVVDICKHAQCTTGKSMQMRNFLLRGPAGTGKTMGAKAIAAGLGLPYMKYTCSAGTEIFDFIGQIFPDSDGGSTGDAQLDFECKQLKAMGGINYTNVAKLMKLPDLDDMDYDPAGVYQALTGMEKMTATSQECMAIVLDKVTEKVKQLLKRTESSQSSGQSFTYVETDFLKALKNGYLVEIQEPTTIMQPGVLVGLNSLLEQTGSITLPTGEIIERHPDAVVVVTTNISYEGCRGMNQSVLDRMSLVQDVESPSPEIMVQRAMSVTGATDEYQVGQMVQVVNDIAEYCRNHGVTDGSYGMRSLIDWIISSEITNNVYESALYTVISKATSDEMEREALISSVLEPIFAPSRKRVTA